MQREEFLSQYNISNADLEDAKIGWDELELIVKGEKVQINLKSLITRIFINLSRT